MTRAMSIAPFLVICVVAAVTLVFPRLSADSVVVTPSPTTTDRHVADSTPTVTAPRPAPTPSGEATPLPTSGRPTTLPPGRHETEGFGPTLSFEVGPDWRVLFDSATELALTFKDDRARIGVHDNAYPPCASERSLDDPHSAGDFADYFDTAPDYDVARSPVSVGGLDGWRIEGTSTGGCGTLVLFYGTPLTVDLTPDIHLIALDTGSGKTIVIYWHANDAEGLALAEGVINSFEFAPAPPPLVRQSTERWLPYLSFDAREGWRLSSDGSLVAELSYDDGRARVHAVNNAYSYCPPGDASEEDPQSVAQFTGCLFNSLDCQVFAHGEPWVTGTYRGQFVDVAASRDCGSFTIGRSPLVTIDLGTHISLIALRGPEGPTIVIWWEAEDGAARAEAEKLIHTISLGFQIAPPPEQQPGLQPGTHASEQWDPGVNYVVDAGWTVQSDSESFLELSLENNRAELTVVNDVYSPCAVEADPASAHSASSLASELSASSGFDMTTTPTSLGGLDGWRVEGVNEGLCGGTYSVFGGTRTPMIVSTDDTVIFLDGPEDKTIAIHWSGENADALASAESVVDSFVFDVPQPAATPGPVQAHALTAGVHSTIHLQPPVEYTVGEGWRVTEDTLHWLELSLGGGARVTIESNVIPFCQRPTPAPHSQSAAEFVAHYLTLATSDHSAPISRGGLSGWRFVGSLDPECGKYVSFRSGGPSVLTLPPSFNVLDGPDGVVLVTWSGPIAQVVVDTLVFDVPPPPPPPTPPACLSPGSGSTWTPPPAESNISSEVISWTPADGYQRILVVLTNDKPVPWREPGAAVVLYDTCGGTDIVKLDFGITLEPGETQIGARTYTKFALSRIEVFPVASPAFIETGTYETCGDPTFDLSEEGNVITSSEFFMAKGNLLDFEIEAVALYRDRIGDLIGADMTTFERRFNRRSDTTPFEVEHSGSISGLASVATYCRIAGGLGFNP